MHYLKTYADSVRDFGHAVVIGFGHEMNAPWYSWGYGHVTAGDLRGRMAAYRHPFPCRGCRKRHVAVDHQRGHPRHRAHRQTGGRASRT